MHVQVGHVALPERDQVPSCAEVGLDSQRLATSQNAEAKPGLASDGGGACHPDLVAAGDAGRVGRRREGLPVHYSVDG
jgi:hypothetical protein